MGSGLFGWSGLVRLLGCCIGGLNGNAMRSFGVAY
jgi:hypothetical protein